MDVKCSTLAPLTAGSDSAVASSAELRKGAILIFFTPPSVCEGEERRVCVAVWHQGSRVEQGMHRSSESRKTAQMARAHRHASISAC